MNITDNIAQQYETFTGQYRGTCIARIWDWIRLRYIFRPCMLVDIGRPDNVDPAIAPLPGEDTAPDPLMQETPTQRVAAYLEMHGPSTTAEIGVGTGLALQHVRNVLHKRTKAGKRFEIHDTVERPGRTGKLITLKRWRLKEQQP